MRRVELMGPPGVGKSTIFRAACAARNTAAPEFKVMRELVDGSGTAPVWSEFAAFVQGCYDGITSSDPIHGRRLEVTQRALRRARRIADAPDQHLVLVDESLCQRGLSLSLSKPGSEDVWRYFEVMPEPAAVLVVITDCETIKARNAERCSDGSGLDRSPDAYACYVSCGIAIAQLRKRGVPVIEIDAGRTVEASVDQVMAAVRSLA